jgi:hypothetical protein
MTKQCQIGEKLMPICREPASVGVSPEPELGTICYVVSRR